MTNSESLGEKVTVLIGELLGPYGSHVNAGVLSYSVEKGSAAKILNELKDRGLFGLVTGNSERQPWQKYNLNGILVNFTPSERTTSKGVNLRYATNLQLADKQNYG